MTPDPGRCVPVVSNAVVEHLSREDGIVERPAQLAAVSTSVTRVRDIDWIDIGSPHSVDPRRIFHIAGGVHRCVLH
jgi:hypothetical protein